MSTLARVRDLFVGSDAVKAATKHLERARAELTEEQGKMDRARDDLNSATAAFDGIADDGNFTAREKAKAAVARQKAFLERAQRVVASAEVALERAEREQIEARLAELDAVSAGVGDRVEALINSQVPTLVDAAAKLERETSKIIDEALNAEREAEYLRAQLEKRPADHALYRLRMTTLQHLRDRHWQAFKQHALKSGLVNSVDWLSRV